MAAATLIVDPPAASVGESLHRQMAELYPLCRSITGQGVRETLAILGRNLPLEIHEVPSGTRALDWQVPPEWEIRDAWIKDTAGRRVVDFRQLNLHVVGYSVPMHARLRWSELRPHLHTLPSQPELVPYRTSYYRPAWGFCLSHRQFRALEALGDQEYEVRIDSSLRDGSLTYGEVRLPGDSPDEVLISSHICHPSLCNDNLSGMVVATRLATQLAEQPRRFTYRFLFAPVTIGAIAWLARNQSNVRRIRHGLVLTLLGDPGRTTYKRSRRGDAPIDRVVDHVLRNSGSGYELRGFEPIGYDERQFCSPGFDLPVGCLMRTPHGEFPEYHTSADNLEFVRPEFLEDSWRKCRSIIEVLEGNRTYLNLFPFGEPQLGRRGVYAALADEPDRQALERVVPWVLNYSDGKHDLLAIAERAAAPFATIRRAADVLLRLALLRETPETEEAP